MKLPLTKLKFVGILAAVLLAGCSTIDYQNRVEGWPVLKQIIHVVSPEEMREACGKYGGFGVFVIACAEFTFDPPVCDVWITEAGGYAEEHERAHCVGFDHPGSDQMRDMLAEWKSTKEKR